MHEKILIVDFGSQYTQLIARRVRALGVYCEIHRPALTLAAVKAFAPKGIILSGGPMSVDDKRAPQCALDVFESQIPILGICYGYQLMARMLGGQVHPSPYREYGSAELTVQASCGPFAYFAEHTALKVWMSHGDQVAQLPPGFVSIGTTSSTAHAAAAHREKRLYGLQFHPEVVHTEDGLQILHAFLFTECGVSGDWTMKGFIEEQMRELPQKIGNGRVICALSGGVDSSVVALLLSKAIGDRLQCIFVDNGLLRTGERAQVQNLFVSRFHISLKTIDAHERFMNKLLNVFEPEEKRKIIGREFIAVFEEAAKTFTDAEFLAQGTLYPDVIESISTRGPSATIKSHHNVGGLPERMHLKLIEPLRDLFKDEVRVLGRELGLPDEVLDRHPFPGPGLAVRMVSSVTEERLRILRQADAIIQQEVHADASCQALWQAFAVLLPVRSVGVMGDERTYEHTCVLRAVTSIDGMTADWARLPYELLARISNRIINEVRGINRVVYDISSKPPATIEWE